MKIALAASEAVPYAKTGGLADVVGALAKLLPQNNCQTLLFLPKYKSIEEQRWKLRRLPGSLAVPVGSRQEPATLFRKDQGRLKVYFIAHPRYFEREGLYTAPQGDYPDNDERFLFFSRAVLESLKKLGWQPDILHCHDWQTALICAYLETLYREDPFFRRTGTLLSLHNLAYQGLFPKESLLKAGFGWGEFTPEKFEFYGCMSFLKAGIVSADLLTTVSPTYAREIQSDPEKGKGLEGVLQKRSQDLTGILNGLDIQLWTPSKDPHLSCRYSASTVLKKKPLCKEFLQKRCGWTPSPTTPLLGIVSRLDPQKGIDLACEVLLPYLKEKSLRTVLLGCGDCALQETLRELARRHPEQIFVSNDFDEPLAHQIYAGCDFFLMPSRFEPCGLGQMIAMRYGTPPIVVRTGGLADTLRDPKSHPEQATGFLAEAPTSSAVQEALERALQTWRQPEQYRRMVHNAIRQDFSWKKSIPLYLETYQRALFKKSK
ncbi:MAG: glycogen synthase [Elusimicrobia bacterium]|nr:glycogen synthase [Elusimicrobiota bacterium]